MPVNALIQEKLLDFERQGIPEVFERDDARQIFWDDVAIVRRPEEYSVHVRRCSPDDILEIDDFDDLRRIDPAYVVRHKDA